MKRILIIALVVCLAASSALAESIHSPGGDGTEPVAWSYGADEEELARAAKLIPDSWGNDLDQTITFAEFSQATSTAVQIWSPEREAEWNEIIRLAAESDEPMEMQDVCLMLSYLFAMEGWNKGYVNIWKESDWSQMSQEERDLHYSELRMDFPLFPDCHTIAYPSYNWDYRGSIVMFAFVRSAVSDKLVLPYDKSANSLHLGDPASRKNAVCALLRMMEYCRVKLEKGNENWSYGADEAELARAARLIPDSWGNDLDQTIIFAEFSQATSAAVRIWSPEREAEWNGIIRLATESNEPMEMQDVCLMLSYLYALEGGGNDYVMPWGFNDWSDVPNEEWGSYATEIRNDFPLFPDCHTMAYPIYQADYRAFILWFTDMMSMVSGKCVLPYDKVENSLHLRDAMSRKDAVCALLRLMEYCRVEMNPDWADYIRLEDAGTYDASIITPELLNVPSDLPEVTQAVFPAEWHGIGYSSHKMFVEEYLHFTEDYFIFTEKMGSNFARLFLNFATFRYPDYPEDPYLVNRNELKELDQCIAWAMKHGMHLQISMHDYMHADGSNPKGNAGAESQPFYPSTKEAWDLNCAYWYMLAERYKDIPSKYLSFELVNEIEPSNEQEFAFATEHFPSFADNMRKIDPDRVLLYAQANAPGYRWTTFLAENGIGIGCHVYTPDNINTWDNFAQLSNPYFDANWPLPLFPARKAARREQPVILQGDLGGIRMGIHLLGYPGEAYAQGTVIEIRADGKTVAEHTVSGNAPETLYPADIPDGTGEVTIQIRNGYAVIDQILLEKGNVSWNIIASDLNYNSPDDNPAPAGSEPQEFFASAKDPLLPLVIHADGTYENSEKSFFDEDYLFNTYVKPYKDIADAHGVGFIIDEFGLFGTLVDFDIHVVTGFAENIIRMAEKNGIPWSYCEMYNTWPKYVCILYGNRAQWRNTTVETVEATAPDGSKTSYLVLKELYDVLSEHMK